MRIALTNTVGFNGHYNKNKTVFNNNIIDKVELLDVFNSMITELVEKNYTYMEAILHIISENNIDMETCVKLLSQKNKEFLRKEAQALNYLPKESSLTLSEITK